MAGKTVFVCNTHWKFRGHHVPGIAYLKGSRFNSGRGYEKFH